MNKQTESELLITDFPPKNTACISIVINGWSVVHSLLHLLITKRLFFSPLTCFKSKDVFELSHKDVGVFAKAHR